MRGRLSHEERLAQNIRDQKLAEEFVTALLGAEDEGLKVLGKIAAKAIEGFDPKRVAEIGGKAMAHEMPQGEVTAAIQSLSIEELRRAIQSGRFILSMVESICVILTFEGVGRTLHDALQQ